MKDVTSTSFGLIIAYLLPGVAALYGTTFWFAKTNEVLQTVLAGKSDISLSLLIAGTAVLVGLLLNVLRWLFFECLIYRCIKLSPSVFAAMKDEHKLQAFLAVIEETFRYHQFLGNIALLTPFIYLCWLKWYEDGSLQNTSFLLCTSLFILLEVTLGILSSDLRDSGTGMKTYLRNVRLAKLVKAKIFHGVAWARRVCMASIIVVIPLSYLITLKLLFGNLNGKYLLYFATVGFVFFGLVIGANSIAALQRYIKRGESLST